MKKDVIFYRILSILISIIIVFFCIYMIMNKIRKSDFLDSKYIITESNLNALSKDTLIAVIPRANNSSEDSFDYKLFDLILSKSGQKYTLGFSANIDLTNSQLISNSLLDIDKRTGVPINNANTFILNSNYINSENLKAINFPVYLGYNSILVNYLNIINKGFFKHVKDYADLDNGLMLNNNYANDIADNLSLLGIPVFLSDNKSFDKLLANNRNSYLPIFMGNFFQNLDDFKIDSYRDNIVLDPYVFFVHPNLFYIFVDKKNIKLYDALNIGMKKAIQDGSYFKLFAKYFLNKKALCSKEFSKRRSIYIPSEILTKSLTKSYQGNFTYISENLPILDFNEFANYNFKTGKDIQETIKKSTAFNSYC